jgi:hypothetical protein
MGKGKGVLQYWWALFGAFNKQTGDCKMYILGLTPTNYYPMKDIEIEIVLPY